MLCQECQKNKATVHIQQVTDNTSETLHVCQTCASNMTMASNFENFFEHFVGSMFSSLPQQTVYDPICEKCHMSFQDFKKIGRLGCSACYEAFEEQTGKIFDNVQRGKIHQGKRPKNFPSFSLSAIHDQANENIDDLKLRLRDEINRAVSIENYEDAVLLRDQLRELEKEAHETSNKPPEKEEFDA